MKSISISQIILLFIFCFLLFGDLQKFKEQTKKFLKQIKQFVAKQSKNRKKGI